MNVRAALKHKLEGLYEHATDERAFNTLAVDKQWALLIFVRRLRELNLWDAVLRVENVYGEGGVGMNFAAQPLMLAMLRGRPDFTRRFAAHHDSSGGFLEQRRSRAALHFLYVDDRKLRWAVHFDLYSPLALPLSAWRHLWHEKIRGLTPDWRAIKSSLWDSAGEYPQ